ncbi:sulfatase family protein [Urechidicola vernalis]|uniref:Arylsulfatase n=1 Tax=Urechidicola vernalis TaxID=3075600 RepID=A0ABU2Y399_9FLAO|nr:arylsulfatase [Urechidicola sp. P050]MDT0552679.1 arylsulfatase [Urechidicola sp. P050]
MKIKVNIGFIIVFFFGLHIHAQEKPNIVYILCDDLGYGDVRALSPMTSIIPTPNLDKLVSQGMHFSNAHSGSSVCTPTRYGLLTGRYAWRTHLQRGVVVAGDGPLIDDDRFTVGEFLQNQGYETALVGKWHLNYTYLDQDSNKELSPLNNNSTTGLPIGTKIPDGPITRGFDYFYGFHHARVMKTVVENDRIVKEIKTVEMLPLLTQKAVEYINERGSSNTNKEPFFLYVPLSSPHGPIVPSKEWKGKSGINIFGDFVMQTDWTVGEILKALDKNGLTDNTIVIFSSDNGTSKIANFKELEEAGHYSTAKSRGSKTDIWDGGHRVPFIVRWPNGKIEPNSKSDQLICLTDLMATCSEILDERLPKNTSEDGVSFLPALYNEEIESSREAVVHHSVDGNFAIRKGKWKLIFCEGSGGWTAPNNKAAKKQNLPNLQLYNIEQDSKEENNLADSNPKVVKELTKLMNSYVENGRSTKGEKLKNDVEVQIIK